MFEEKVKYEKLNARQKEIYNFQKVSAVFADYGYTTVKLSDDWMGADFIAISFDGMKYLKIQLKGRLTFDKKYLGKDIYICFHDDKNDNWYLYGHDEILQKFIKSIENSDTWKIGKPYHYKYLQPEHIEFLNPFVIG
jgi:hypothetical protein